MENKKHILFISSWYPNKKDPTLGIFNRYFALAASLYNSISVLNVVSEEHLKEEFLVLESKEDGIYSITVSYRKITSRVPGWSQLIKRKKVLKAFDIGYAKIKERSGKPDLIQLNVIMPMGIGAFNLSKKHRIPYVVNENWSGYTAEDGNYKSFLQQLFTRRIVKHAKALMPTSTYLKEAMLSHGLEGNYQVVPNVVNTNVFKPGNNGPGHGTRLVHISSLNDREKNVSGLIRAFAKATLSGKELYLDIVGEGIDKDKYIALVKTLGLESKIKFKGRLFSEDLVKEINASDALIMFSHFETFCLVIIEAFACGKPVITSNAGAIKTYMKPELGVMVEKDDEDKLTGAILQFVSEKNKFNKDFIRSYAVENYSYEKVGKTLDEIYSKALQK